MMGSKNERGNIDANILQFCENYWKEHKKALLLSYLGSNLGRAGIENIEEWLGGRKLLEVVRDNYVEHLRIEEDPNNSGIWGVFPKDADLEGDLRTYFKRGSVRTDSWNRPAQRFDRGLWAAFTWPLADESIRLIEFGSEVRFSDIGREAAEISGALKIDSNLIVPRSDGFDPDRYSKIRANIEAWASANNVDVFKLLQRPSRKVRRVNIEPDLPVSGDTALHKFLGLIDQRDLSRIEVPLDVIAGLLNKKNS